MKSKYTHKFIIYNKKRIRENYNGLVEKLADFDEEAIPKDFLENLNESSEMFSKKRCEFYHRNPGKMCTIDEILPYDEQTNVATNKVLAFVKKYYEFDKLIVGIDYFDGEDEYIEKYFHHDDGMYFGGVPRKFYVKIFMGYYYGLDGNELDIFLKDIELENLI